jgi:hypothetical protein
LHINLVLGDWWGWMWFLPYICSLNLTQGNDSAIGKSPPTSPPHCCCNTINPPRIP